MALVDASEKTHNSVTAVEGEMSVYALGMIMLGKSLSESFHCVQASFISGAVGHPSPHFQL